MSVAAPGVLAPAAGQKVSFMSLIDNEDPDDLFELIDEIAVGSYGSVYKSRHLPTNSIVAMKIMEPDEDEEIDDFAAEIAVLRDCSHPNICNFVGAYKKGDEIFIAMEFCDGGAANDIFKSIKEPMPEAEIKAITNESMKGLQYLHGMRIVHRDIKAANILLCSDGRCKLADFGVAALLANNPVGAYSFIGTPYWMAPEVIDNKSASINPYDMKADIWSMGIVCLELAQVTPPLSDVHPMKALFQIPLNEPPQLSDPSRWSADFPNFLARCLVKDPKQRADADECLAHAWLQNNDHASAIRALCRRVKGLPPVDSDNEDSDKEDDESSAAAAGGAAPEQAAVAAAAAAAESPSSSPATPAKKPHGGAAASPLAASGAADDDDDDEAEPNFDISEDDAGDVPTAKEVINSTVRKSTIARTNRPQKQLTHREEITLANQIRARKLLKKQMKEIDKLKKVHQQQEKALEAALQRDEEAKLGVFQRRKDQAAATEAATIAKLQKHLTADKANLEKKHQNEMKSVGKAQKTELKDVSKKMSATAKTKQKQLANELKKEQKAKEDSLKRRLKEDGSGKSKRELKEIEKQQKDALARWVQQRELECAQQLELEKLSQEQEQQRKANDRALRANYEHLHVQLNLELENHDALQRAQTKKVVAINAVERERLLAAQPIDVAQLKAKQERALSQLTELHAIEQAHLTAVIEEETRFQSRELTNKLRKEQKKYARKQKKERKKHANISKSDWKKLCREEDAKRAAKVKKRKEEFKAKMETERREQAELQKKSHEHTRAQFAERQRAELEELLAKQKSELANLDSTLLQKRVELLLEQHKATAALVYKQFKTKYEARAAMNKERYVALAEHLTAIGETVMRHHAAMLPLHDAQQQAQLKDKQAEVIAQMRAQHAKTLAHLQAKSDADINKINEGFLRLLDTIIQKQEAEVKALNAELAKVGGKTLPVTVEAEQVKETVAQRYQAALQKQKQQQQQQQHHANTHRVAGSAAAGSDSPQRQHASMPRSAAGAAAGAAEQHSTGTGGRGRASASAAATPPPGGDAGDGAAVAGGAEPSEPSPPDAPPPDAGDAAPPPPDEEPPEFINTDGTLKREYGAPDEPPPPAAPPADELGMPPPPADDAMPPPPDVEPPTDEPPPPAASPPPVV